MTFEIVKCLWKNNLRQIHEACLITTICVTLNTGVPGGKVNILGGHSIDHYKKKKVYMNMYPIPNGFRYLAHNIFLPSLSMSNHDSQLTLHTDSHASDIGALRREGKKILNTKFKILRAKYRKPFGIGHVHINFFS
jgi:hypothetical protein